jgi:hypothetical protein
VTRATAAMRRVTNLRRTGTRTAATAGMHSMTKLCRASTRTAATMAGTASMPAATLFRSGICCGRKCSRENYNDHPHIKY